jgi:5-methylcytosine-specific restriction endonuclease McrA
MRMLIHDVIMGKHLHEIDRADQSYLERSAIALANLIQSSAEATTQACVSIEREAIRRKINDRRSCDWLYLSWGYWYANLTFYWKIEDSAYTFASERYTLLGRNEGLGLNVAHPFIEQQKATLRRIFPGALLGNVIDHCAHCCKVKECGYFEGKALCYQCRTLAEKAHLKEAEDRRRLMRSPQVNIAAIERAKMKPSLRYSVLMRDGYACKICGRTASDGVKLHVDHVIPVSKGGKTELNNLQTLCQECNAGKADTLPMLFAVGGGAC